MSPSYCSIILHWARTCISVMEYYKFCLYSAAVAIIWWLELEKSQYYTSTDGLKYILPWLFPTGCLHSGYFGSRFVTSQWWRVWSGCFSSLNSPWCVCLRLMKQRWKTQSIPSAHIFIHWQRGATKQRRRGRGLWNDNACSSSSRQRHALLLARNVLTNRGRPQRQPLLLLCFFGQ